MRHDIIFNYDYLLERIEERYKENTLNKNINSLCKEVYYLTSLRFKNIVIHKRGYFTQNEIIKISEVLKLNHEEIIKCFLKVYRR